MRLPLSLGTPTGYCTCLICDELYPCNTACPCRGIRCVYPRWVRLSIWFALGLGGAGCWGGLWVLGDWVIAWIGRR